MPIKRRHAYFGKSSTQRVFDDTLQQSPTDAASAMRRVKIEESNSAGVLGFGAQKDTADTAIAGLNDDEIAPFVRQLLFDVRQRFFDRFRKVRTESFDGLIVPDVL